MPIEAVHVLVFKVRTVGPCIILAAKSPNRFINMQLWSQQIRQHAIMEPIVDLSYKVCNLPVSTVLTGMAYSILRSSWVFGENVACSFRFYIVNHNCCIQSDLHLIN